MIDLLPEGTLVAGHYRVLSVLGSGGMGVVYRAVHETLEREVALKLLRPGLGLIDALKERFIVEARAASRLSHAGAVVVYDFGEWEGQLFMAMELLKGRSLDRVIREEFPFASEDIVDILSQACEVLHAAHSAGVMHRDIKPENIMLLDGTGQRRTLKVVDFGLAFMLDKSQNRLTMEGTTIGTPAYMSPEQGLARAVDARSDIYSLGVVLYEMLCGTVPFDGNPSEVLVKHLYEEPRRPNDMNKDVPVHRGLSELAMACLSKNPDDRPESALALRDRMMSALHSRDAESASPLKKPPKKKSRLERALAEGLVVPAPRDSLLPSEEAARSRLLVVERTAHFADSITAALRAKGFQVERVSDLEEAATYTADESPDAFILDLVGDSENRLKRLSELLEAGVIERSRVLVVGPSDDFAPMSRALELGVADYVPISAIATKLQKALSRVLKRNR